MASSTEKAPAAPEKAGGRNESGPRAPHGPAAHEASLTTTLREYLVRYRRDLDARVQAGANPIVVGRAYAKAIDGLLSALLPCTQATLSQVGKWMDCSLAAVGSYGRGVLAPRSDLDVRIVVDRDAERA
ncbi:MAG: nucleotidyltransferase domain-containing protein, partial [Polyangiales bacterium]